MKKESFRKSLSSRFSVSKNYFPALSLSFSPSLFFSPFRQKNLLQNSRYFRIFLLGRKVSLKIKDETCWSSIFEPCYLQIGISGWLTGHYNFRCQPVDYSNHPSTLRVILPPNDDINYCDFVFDLCFIILFCVNNTSFPPTINHKIFMIFYLFEMSFFVTTQILII